MIEWRLDAHVQFTNSLAGSMNNIKIVKAFGEKELFSEQKLRRSLKRSGAEEHVITSVVDEIGSHIKDGMHTKEIYKQAFDLLRQYSPPHAARYKLKQAINDLGPSGFPFELYIAELFKREGYDVQTGILFEGRCVKHEIDVVAQREKDHFLIECKFHNSQGIHCDVKIPLYIQSRFLDVTAKWKLLPTHESKNHQAWLVTNTRFTDDAITYGNCMGITLNSWNYPSEKSLREWVNKSGLHPLTCLTTLTGREKQYLLEQKNVLCKDIINHPFILKGAGIKNQSRIDHILNEAKKVCLLH
jgi:hypothetical protein